MVNQQHIEVTVTAGADKLGTVFLPEAAVYGVNKGDVLDLSALDVTMKATVMLERKVFRFVQETWRDDRHTERTIITMKAHFEVIRL